MCGLFGYYSYSQNNYIFLKELVKNLGKESTVRGTHATGIAYEFNNEILVKKEPKSAQKFHFDFPVETKVLIGHTRNASNPHKRNWLNNENNHPFLFKSKNMSFALAHNGVVYNQDDIRMHYNMKVPKISTDTYIIYQMIQHFGLSLQSLKDISEQLYGIYTYTVLDNHSNLYIVRHEHPLVLLHFKDLQLYVYASTEKILFNAIFDTPYLCKKLKQSLSTNPLDIELIEMNMGEIYQIDKTGTIHRQYFVPESRVIFTHTGNKYKNQKSKDYAYTSGYYYNPTETFISKDDFGTEEEYYEMCLKLVEEYGYDETYILDALEVGYTLEDILDHYYNGTLDDLFYDVEIAIEYYFLDDDTQL
ncbi:MAG: hypothetical protein N2043_01645 [Ignavibacterium sp.]|nr:hypothetical protein [Ignavibacterium sp.]